MTWVLVPEKGLAHAKSRLAPVLEGSARTKLVLAMLDTVISAASRCPEVDEVVVITDCPDVAPHAIRLGARIEHDPPVHARHTRLAAVVDHGLGRLASLGATRALVLMGDLPLLRREDVAAALSVMARGAVALAPDRFRSGTNALGLPTLRSLTQTHFGHADSLARHEHACARRGLAFEHLDRPGLAFDLDTPDDLRVLHPEPTISLFLHK